MLTHISHLDTEAALALVNDEASALEDGTHLLVLVVEIVEGHEIAQQAVEVAVDVEESAHHLDALSLLLESVVLCDEVEQCLLLVVGKELADGVDTQCLYLSTLLGTLPSAVGSEGCTDGCPRLGGERLLLGLDDSDKCLELVAPCRVD